MGFLRRLPAIKCIILSDRAGGSHLFTYYAEDMEFVVEMSPAFLTGVSAGMNVLYQDISS